MDEQHVTVLVLLDLSAAFDTVEHSVLLDRLENRLGITGFALNWMKSYLENRKQTVVIKNVRSESQNLDCGVPQGSVLGPILFTLYTSPLGDIVRKHGLLFHLYADDTQLYLSFNSSTQNNADTAVQKITNCISEIRRWMAVNNLKLNDDKTEVLVLGKKEHRSKISIPSLMIGNSSVQVANSARNIGIIQDKELNMEKHISAICKSAHYHLRNIGQIRKYLNKKSTEAIVHAFVSSKLDNGNSLLYGLPLTQINRLQRVQNTAARIIMRLKKFEHVSGHLKSLHWLPVKARIDFKILLLTYKALNGQAPVYIKELLQPYKSPRNQRLNQKGLLHVPQTRYATCGDRAFYKAAPKLWNNLPIEIKHKKTLMQFKNALKSYLFIKYS